jgi:hypothetical protein
MTIAVGGFAIGIACAVAAHSVVTDFLKPTAPPEVAATQDDPIAQVPIYATAAAPAAASAEQISRNRTRSVAKVTLPSIGTRAPSAGADTDGRGGATVGRAGEALASEPNPAAAVQAVAAAPTSGTEAEIKPAADPAAAAPEPPKAKQKARASSKSTRTAKRKRARSEYASGYRNPSFFGWGGQQPYYARQQYYGRYQYY